MFNDVFSLYHSYYRKIFSVLYPAKNSTGFTERNLSVNFSKAYEVLNPDSVSWFEFQFGERNNLHYDCIVVNAEKKEILIIESKRFSNPSSKVAEIENDITRINLSRGIYSEEFSTRISNFPDYKIYGIILADVWTETKEKRRILQSFKDSKFLEYAGILPDNGLTSAEYFSMSFSDITLYPWINNNYYLLAITWEVI